MPPRSLSPSGIILADKPAGPSSFAIVAATGDIYAGLWYPIVVAALTVVVGLLWLRETRNAPAAD